MTSWPEVIPFFAFPEEVRRIVYTIDDALLAHLSPMGWAHISLTGDYLWHRANRLSPGEFRTLNDPMARLKLVA